MYIYIYIYMCVYLWYVRQVRHIVVECMFLSFPFRLHCICEVFMVRNAATIDRPFFLVVDSLSLSLVGSIYGQGACIGEGSLQSRASPSAFQLIALLFFFFFGSSSLIYFNRFVSCEVKT